MKVNEVKVTKTIEEVVRTEYIASDGTVFSDKAECEKYERSALCAVKSKLRWLSRKGASVYTVNDEGSSDYEVDILDIRTERDLDYLKQYVYLSCVNGGIDRENSLKNLEAVTIGHPVLIQWSFDHDYCTVYGDGSPEAYGNYFKGLYLKEIKMYEREANGNVE